MDAVEQGFLQAIREVRLLSGGADHEVHLWDVRTCVSVAAWDWQIGPIHAVAWSDDSMTAAGEEPTVVVWDLLPRPGRCSR